MSRVKKQLEGKSSIDISGMFTNKEWLRMWKSDLTATSEFVRRTMKSYYKHCSCMITILLNASLFESILSTYFVEKLQTWTKYLGKRKESKQNWKGAKNFDNWFCVIFDHCYKSYIARRNTGHEALCLPNFDIFLIFLYIF